MGCSDLSNHNFRCNCCIILLDFELKLLALQLPHLLNIYLCFITKIVFTYLITQIFTVCTLQCTEKKDGKKVPQQ